MFWRKGPKFLSVFLSIGYIRGKGLMLFAVLCFVIILFPLLQEILFPLFFLFLRLILISMMHPNKKYEEVPDVELSALDSVVLANVVLGFSRD